MNNILNLLSDKTDYSNVSFTKVKVAVDHCEEHEMYELEISDEIFVVADTNEQIGTVFYNDVELVFQWNKYSKNLICNMKAADENKRIHLMQLLRFFAVKTVQEYLM